MSDTQVPIDVSTPEKRAPWNQYGTSPDGPMKEDEDGTHIRDAARIEGS
jgi:hypothetical protein